MNNDWINVDIEKPQPDFSVIASCDDDVKQCTFRDTDEGYYFEDEKGGIFNATHWMSLPPAYQPRGSAC